MTVRKKTMRKNDCYLLAVEKKGSHSPGGDIPSLIKWTGSKRSQATRIAESAPERFGRYFEPFLGGGAMLYKFGHKGAVGGDIYKPLIDFWIMVRDNPEHLIQDYTAQWGKLQESLPDYYYEVRDRFNLEQKPEDLNFLMRTCVNGIVRFSKQGCFNNSFHLSRKGMQPARFAKTVFEWSKHIQDVEFRIGDFEETLEDAKGDDFVYLDPPYAGNKQRYIGNLEVERFYGVLGQLNSKGVKWALSFDGARGDTFYGNCVPKEIYKRKLSLYSGYSPVSKVLNGPMEMVTESLYVNY
jgi:DNA adenine methylase